MQGNDTGGRVASPDAGPIHPTGLAALVDTAERIWTHPDSAGRRGRRLARWLAWQASQRTTRRPWTVTLHDDVRMICHPKDHVTALVLYCGLYDAPEMRFLLAWLRAGDTFLDVGANVAPYSLLASSVPGTRAVAFEPGSLAHDRARANIALNSLEGRVALEPVAVSDTDGEAMLTADRWAMNTLVDTYAGAVETVSTVRLDSYAAGHDLGRVSLVKVDVEGHELAVLRGATSLLERHRPALILEHNDGDGTVRALVEGLGYAPVALDVRARRLDEASWPAEPGGNLVLVTDRDAARRRVAEGLAQAFGAA